MSEVVDGRPDLAGLPGMVIFVEDKARVSAFYQQTLGLSVAESDESYDLLLSEACEIVIHCIPEEYRTGKADQPVAPRVDTPIKPSFVVASLARVRAAAEATGGMLKPADQAWHYRGHIVLDGWDPEGNVVQFKQQV